MPYKIGVEDAEQVRSNGNPEAVAVVPRQVAMCGCVTMLITMLILLIVLLTNIVSLGPEEQLLVHLPDGERKVINGPGTHLTSPFQKMERRSAIRLTNREYAVVVNERTGINRHEEDATLLFLGPYDRLVEKKFKIVLREGEYVRLIDKLTGIERIVAGPVMFTPGPLEEAPHGTETGLVLSARDYLLVQHQHTGAERVVRGPGIFIPEPYEKVSSEGIQQLAWDEQWPQDASGSSSTSAPLLDTSAQLFASMDEDADGFISMSEFDAARNRGVCS
eukprot:gnl/TRDRNA2_/TRDRNA2_201749_c0_seq1.p1 gnl/TRDRNA2_/TRDRNA2_201749_c0~~gnl/TRDRNA2_/TRDRNA2_201749_c0_seq1.p1  ORF type:complete len:276 (-),score=42.22 gnl/TRDRNA2_/TRDRNA2_201749_c0_seq1:288-1115(-)